MCENDFYGVTITDPKQDYTRQFFYKEKDRAEKYLYWCLNCNQNNTRRKHDNFMEEMKEETIPAEP